MSDSNNPNANRSSTQSSSNTQPSNSTIAPPPPRLSSIRARGTPRPRYTGRRSATARAELEKEAAQKKAEEARISQAEARDNARRAGRGLRGGSRGGVERGGGADAGRGRGRGRGGFMDEMIASGPFSSGQVVHDVRSGRRGGGMGRASGGGGGGGGFAGGGYGGPSGRGGVKSEGREVGMGGTKREDGGYISTDDDEDEDVKGVPRMNVDNLQTGTIDLTEDDGAFAPVRLTRVPHQPRKLGLALTNDLTKNVAAMDIKSDPDAALDRKKSKPRAKDVEITGSISAPTRARTYSSSSETEGGQVIKDEPMDDDIPLETLAQAPGTDAAGSRPPDVPSSPESKRKTKDRIKADIDLSNSNPYGFRKPPNPKLYTDAERLEWELRVTDQYLVFEELGYQVPPNTEPPSEHTDATQPNPARIAYDAAKDSEATRNERTYLFQFPPILPTLLPTSDIPDKPLLPTEPSDPTSTAAQPQPTPKPKPKAPLSPPPPGHIGKLRIHQSGKAYLDYGGFQMEVSMGMSKAFPEQIVVVDLPEEKKRRQAAAEGRPAGNVKTEEDEKMDVDGDKATAYSMGLVRGEFVVTPDLDELLKL